jgi:phage baseplate assembly protein W
MAALINTNDAFLGTGLSFPTATDTRGSVSIISGAEDIRQSIQIILATNYGERVMRPDFGASLRDFVFEPADLSTIHRVQTRVQEALIDWEPRIDVLEVDVTLDAVTRSTLVIDIDYRVRASNTIANLVYPFYLEEGSSPDGSAR